MDLQKKWALGVLNLEIGIPAVSILKELAELLWYKICYHPPMLVDQLDLAREKDQHVFVYLSREKMEGVLKEGSVVFGRDAVLATTIQPYRCDLPLEEMLRVHNGVWPHSETKEPDLECFIAIFASTLFVHLRDLKVTALHGKEAACPFFVRRGTLDRPYDVVACGKTWFSKRAGRMPLWAAPSHRPDLTLRLSALDYEAKDDQAIKPGTANIKKED